jgi:hypothetical protein
VCEISKPISSFSFFLKLVEDFSRWSTNILHNGNESERFVPLELDEGVN